MTSSADLALACILWPIWTFIAHFTPVTKHDFVTGGKSQTQDKVCITVNPSQFAYIDEYIQTLRCPPAAPCARMEKRDDVLREAC